LSGISFILLALEVRLCEPVPFERVIDSGGQMSQAGLAGERFRTFGDSWRKHHCFVILDENKGVTVLRITNNFTRKSTPRIKPAHRKVNCVTNGSNHTGSLSIIWNVSVNESQYLPFIVSGTWSYFLYLKTEVFP
jgi:hypothetical protein